MISTELFFLGWIRESDKETFKAWAFVLHPTCVPIFNDSIHIVFSVSKFMPSVFFKQVHFILLRFFVFPKPTVLEATSKKNINFEIYEGSKL